MRVYESDYRNFYLKESLCTLGESFSLGFAGTAYAQGVVPLASRRRIALRAKLGKINRGFEKRGNSLDDPNKARMAEETAVVGLQANQGQVHYRQVKGAWDEP